jgi:hypothetical protein
MVLFLMFFLLLFCLALQLLKTNSKKTDSKFSQMLNVAKLVRYLLSEILVRLTFNMRLMGYCYFDLPLFYTRASDYLFLTVVFALLCLFGESIAYSVGDNNSPPPDFKHTVITATAGEQNVSFGRETFGVNKDTHKISFSVRAVDHEDPTQQAVQGAVSYQFGNNLMSRGIAAGLSVQP